MMLITVIYILLLFAGRSHSGLLPSNVSSVDFNETDVSPPLVIYNSNNETSLVPNQFAETVVDLLLDLLEKANLSRTVSVIHNETELTELVEQDPLANRSASSPVGP